MAKGYLSGKYGTGEAGIRHRLSPKDWGTPREFVGSGQYTYYFKLPNGNILIVRANTWKEAWVDASSRGARQYRKSDGIK